MAWIQSHQSLGRHPKLLRLAARAGISNAQAVGHLQYLWWWTLEYAPDGDLSRFNAQEIAFASEWTGDPEFWFTVLKDTGWLDPDGHLHDWDDYAGKLAQDRAKDRERKRAQRARKKPENPSPPPDPCPPDVLGTTFGHPAPDKTIQDKRREEVERVCTRAGAPTGDEPPPGFPRDEAEVVASAGDGESSSFALKLWHLAASRGWRDARGIPLRNWRSYLAASLAFSREAAESGRGARRTEQRRSRCRENGQLHEVIIPPII